MTYKKGEKMKRYIVFLVFVLCSFLLFTQAKATCPDGWVERPVVIDNFPACNYYITARVCLRCNISAPFIQFKITEIIGIDSCIGFYLPSFIDFLCARLSANYFEFCPGGYIPCAAGRRDIYVYIPLCFYENDEQPFDFLFCQENWCVEHWSVCTLPDGTVDVVKLSDSQLVGNPPETCIKNPYPQPPGVCFHIETECTP